MQRTGKVIRSMSLQQLIGISFLSGQHEAQMNKLLEAMKKANLDIPVMCVNPRIRKYQSFY